MNISILFPIIAAIIMMVILSNTVTPSIIQQIKSTKVENGITVEKALYEAICRYITLESSIPSLIDLTSKNYFPSISNNNGFNGAFDFSIDAFKGTITIFTDIADSTARAQYLNSYKNTFKPVLVNTQTVSTTFIIPTSIMHGNGQFMTGIPVQSVAPDPSTNRYWYDTSGDYVYLKMSNGFLWKNIATSEPTSVGNVASGTGSLSSGMTGDVKYAFDSVQNEVVKYIYYSGEWHKSP